jgi:hypothetical protein
MSAELSPNASSACAEISAAVTRSAPVAEESLTTASAAPPRMVWALTDC